MNGLRKRKKLSTVLTFYVYASRSNIVSYFSYARKTHVKNYATMEIHLYSLTDFLRTAKNCLGAHAPLALIKCMAALRLNVAFSYLRGWLYRILSVFGLFEHVMPGFHS